MPVGLHRRRRYDLRAYDPHAGAPSRVAEQAHRQIDAGRERFGFGADGDPIESGEIAGAAGRNKYRVRSSEDRNVVVEVPSATSARLAPGTKATIAHTRAGAVIIAPPVGGERRKSEAPGQRQSRQDDAIYIVRTDPVEVTAGSTEEVTFYGGPFRETPVDVLVPLVPDLTAPPSEWEEDAEVTVGTVTWVSEGEITANVTVDAGRNPATRITLDPRRG